MEIQIFFHLLRLELIILVRFITLFLVYCRQVVLKPVAGSYTAAQLTTALQGFGIPPDNIIYADGWKSWDSSTNQHQLLLLQVLIQNLFI